MQFETVSWPTMNRVTNKSRGDSQYLKTFQVIHKDRRHNDGFNRFQTIIERLNQLLTQSQFGEKRQSIVASNFNDDNIELF